MTDITDGLTEPDLTLARSLVDIKIKQDACVRLFGLGTGERWDVDLDKGSIQFTQPDLIATAPVQVIGTFNENDSTWLWGWDHPSIEGSLAQSARLCQVFGMRYDQSVHTAKDSMHPG